MKIALGYAMKGPMGRESLVKKAAIKREEGLRERGKSSFSHPQIVSHKGQTKSQNIVEKG